MFIMRKIVIILTVLVSISTNSKSAEIDSVNISPVVTKTMGDSAYMKSDYLSAIQVYESLLSEGEAADLYYNLGNSYYKSGEIGKAILNYERALLLEPGNNDIRFNLDMAKAKTIDKIESTPEIFFVTWTKSLINMWSINAWAYCAIIFFIIFIISLYLFFFSKTMILKKIGFFVGAFSLFIVVAANIFANQQKQELTNRDSAVVMTPNVVVRSTPSESGTNLFVLHEGHKVSIKDNTMKDWKEIRLGDGKVGWVPTSSIEII